MAKLLKSKLSRKIVILTAVLLVLFGITVYKDNKSLVESGAGAALNPVQKVIYSTNKRMESLIDFFLRYEDVKKENEDLLLENIELEAKLRSFESLQEENEKLKEMFSIKNRQDQYDYLGTNVIGRTGGGIITSYIIDKGSDDGLQAGMAVMSQEGIVGQITETAATWSVVETLSSENISIHVTTVEDKMNSGILEGHIGSGQKQMAKISYLPIDSSIKEGDDVVTSGLGRFYPPDFYIGEVVRVEEDKGNLMKTAIVETAVNFNDTRMLFVILPKNMEDVEY
ncbi:rod shape-determining protein MreC [Proteiniclasticum sp. SCR006]|uniref:Cell shape-determining protein MreC n=1 Tax=Proteiniclasticum aestuarii TaxID=2817862 RepID=A0A939HCE8_9CLOT|nr:rod shape-determining protein MreC [Proteiniclasticum aestuarii]MBO1265765.1 rod shape-determining protein MreC [Proteiniclasticum aestuarii]